MKSLNVFLVKHGFEHGSATPNPNDGDADYKPILRIQERF